LARPAAPAIPRAFVEARYALQQTLSAFNSVIAR
jgi:hypothetical protein